MRPRFVDLEPVPSGRGPGARDALFLGRFDGAALRAELEQAGILPGLAELGFVDLRVRFLRERDEHRLVVATPGHAAPLLDLRLAEVNAVLPEPRRSRLALQVSSFLAVAGLTLQRPDASFTPQRPPLPGQSHPGTGLYRRLRERLSRWADDWSKDGLLSFPAHYHVAAMDAGDSRFLSPAREGVFQGLRTALEGRPLHDASWAVEKGLVHDRSGGPLSWVAAEAVAPLSDELRGWLASPAYARLAEQARPDAVAPARA
jgi:hypothetical protein